VGGRTAEKRRLIVDAICRCDERRDGFGTNGERLFDSDGLHDGQRVRIVVNTCAPNCELEIVGQSRHFSQCTNGAGTQLGDQR